MGGRCRRARGRGGRAAWGFPPLRGVLGGERGGGQGGAGVGGAVRGCRAGQGGGGGVGVGGGGGGCHVVDFRHCIGETLCVLGAERAGQGRAGQGRAGRAGQGRAGQGRAGRRHSAGKQSS